MGKPHLGPAHRPRLLRTAGLVALITLREILRRRGALALALLLPLTFYLARIDVHWTALRLLSIGLGWAAATLGLFTAVSSRPVDRRLAASGAESCWTRSTSTRSSAASPTDGLGYGA